MTTPIEKAKIRLREAEAELRLAEEAHHQELFRVARQEAKDFLFTHPDITLCDLSEYTADAARAHGSTSAKAGSCDTSPSWIRFRVLLAELARRGDGAMRRLSEKSPNHVEITPAMASAIGNMLYKYEALSTSMDLAAVSALMKPLLEAGAAAKVERPVSPNDLVPAARLERKAKGYAPTNIFEAVRKIDPTARVHVTHDAFEINCAPEKVDEVTRLLHEVEDIRARC